jgi:D-alanine-D-alanine ligase-like ATP-grasp enzyme
VQRAERRLAQAEDAVGELVDLEPGQSGPRGVRRPRRARAPTIESVSMSLSNVLIVYESEAAARRRLVSFGYAPEIAAEIAVYLGQATDLPDFFDDIAAAAGRAGLAVEFVEAERLLERLPDYRARRASTIVWSVTDGVRYYLGSAVSAVSRLAGLARFGAPATAQHLCQDKFASLALAAAAGLAVAPTRLMEGGVEVAALGDWPSDAGALFVKPNALGAKIGIFADSRCGALAEAKERAARLWERYGDRALIQPFVPGDDVRVSFMDTGGAFADQLGVEQLRKDPASETGGAFMTMKDNETLSGARDTSGTRGGFGAERAAAFVPRMINLRQSADPRARRAVAEIVEMSERLARLLGLRDYFSLDFRIDDEGRATFFEFEICPGVTIYDFQNYLASVHGLSLGEALARAFKIAFGRSRAIGEA